MNFWSPRALARRNWRRLWGLPGCASYQTAIIQVIKFRRGGPMCPPFTEGAHAGAPLQTVSCYYFYERNLVSVKSSGVSGQLPRTRPFVWRDSLTRLRSFGSACKLTLASGTRCRCMERNMRKSSPCGQRLNSEPLNVHGRRIGHPYA
jgi:hypothetical protein